MINCGTQSWFAQEIETCFSETLFSLDFHFTILEIFSLIGIEIHFGLSLFLDFLNGSIDSQHCPNSQQNWTGSHNDVHNSKSQNGRDQSVHDRNCIDDQPKPKQTRNFLESSDQETKINDQVHSGKAKADLEHQPDGLNVITFINVITNDVVEIG